MRVASAVVAVVGALLILVGVVAFVSAAKINSDAQSTKDQVAALENETAALQGERDAKRAEASPAATKADKLSADTTAVKVAVVKLHGITHETVAAVNDMVGCDSIANDAAFVACTNSSLERLQTALTTQVNAVADARKAIATLEEDLRA